MVTSKKCENLESRFAGLAVLKCYILTGYSVAGISVCGMFNVKCVVMGTNEVSCEIEGHDILANHWADDRLESIRAICLTGFLFGFGVFCFFSRKIIGA